MTAPCATCGTPFTVTALRTRFCQMACYRAWQRTQGADTLVDRFWEKVNQTPSCWLWTASQIKGYGQFHLSRVGGKNLTVYAHRFAWEQTNGPIPDNLYVLHRCDTPLCVRPDHLFLGSQAENLADARQKGRLVDGRHLIKVSESAFLDIRANYRPRKNGKQLAAKYGISLGHLQRIVKGTARVQRPIFERVPSVQVPIRGEVA